MDDQERKACLDRLGQMIIDARDETFDEIMRLQEEDGGGSIASFVRARYRQGQLGKDDLCDVITYYVDAFILDLAYKLQDAEVVYDLSLTVRGASGDDVALDRLSDGLAGEFMTENGWFERKSKHGRNAFER